MNKLIVATLLIALTFNASGMTEEDRINKELKRIYTENKDESCWAIRQANYKPKTIEQIKSALTNKKAKLKNKQTSPNTSKHVQAAFLYGAFSLAFSGFGLYNLYCDNNLPYNISYMLSAALGLGIFLPNSIHHVLKWKNYEDYLAGRFERTKYLKDCFNRNPGTPKKTSANNSPKPRGLRKVSGIYENIPIESPADQTEE